MGLGLISKLLSFTRVTRNGAKISDVKIDPGGGPNVTAEHYAPPGDDSYPLKTDYVYAGSTEKTGGKAALGYVDPLNSPKALEGEKRIYARDPGTGAIIGEVWLENDGTITLVNANGSFTLNADGSNIGNNLNGFYELDASGNITLQNSAGSIKLLSSGTVNMNGVTIDPSGNIVTSGTISGDDVTATNQNVTLSTHGHPALNTAPNPGS